MNRELWLARRDWAARRIKDENASGAWGFLIFALVWTGFTCGLSYLFMSQKDDGAGRYFVLIFPVVGVLLLAGAIYGLLRRRRYGVPVFELATLPAPVGRALAGIVRTRAVFDPAGGFVVKLECIHRTVTQSGKNRSTRDNVLWSGKRTIPGATPEGEGIAIPIAVAIPPDARETDSANANNRVLWRLQVSAAVEGIDFSTQFEVPVFRTAESETPLTPEELARFAP